MIAALGPRTVVVKRGEYGALLLADDAFFVAPAYPLESGLRPDGSGDTFAGGFMGYLAFRAIGDGATCGGRWCYGSVMASFTVEDFSLNRLSRLDAREIDRRYAEFEDLIRLERCHEPGNTGEIRPAPRDCCASSVASSSPSPAGWTRPSSAARREDALGDRAVLVTAGFGDLSGAAS